jgi:hypothetical protein
MINMNSLKRIVSFAGAFLLAGAMVGCGDDDGNPPVDPPDAGAPDANAPDATVVVPDAGSPTTLPEFGEFRLEQFQTGPSGTGEEDYLATQAMFFTGQNPPARGQGIPIAIRPDIAAQGYVCVDYKSGDNGDNGKTPEGQVIVDTREYVDIGATATATNLDDDSVITLAKFEGALDPDGATDLSSSLVHDVIYKGDVDTALDLGGRYQPAVAGSPMYGPLDLKNGESIVGEERADADALIYVASDFQLTTPTEADFFDPAGLTFTTGQDFQFAYTIEEPETVGPGNFPTIVPFIGIVSEGVVEVYCLKFTPGTLDDGTFTLPHETFAEFTQNPADGDETSYIVFGRFTRTFWETKIAEQAGRIDLVALTCAVAQDWVVNPAP